VDQLIGNQGTKKFVKKTNSKTLMSEEKIQNDAQWDGMHGVITNIKDEGLESILSKYKGLWQIEAAFRLNKHDLRMRPIYHWKERRIKAHFLICYLSYTLASYIKFKLKENGVNLSFEVIRDELLKSEASVLLDQRSRKKFLLPSKSTENQRKIYGTFGLVKQEKIIRLK